MIMLCFAENVNTMLCHKYQFDELKKTKNIKKIQKLN